MKSSFRASAGLVALIAIVLFMVAVRTVGSTDDRYSAPPGWEELTLPNNPNAHTGIWHRGRSDIRDLTPWPVPSTGVNKASVEMWFNARPLPAGWKLVSSLVSPQRGCSSQGWWVRRTFQLANENVYREVYFLFEGHRSGVGMLLYTLRDNALTEDPTVISSFIHYCRTYH